jgi:glycosyltransferase involved in cell wall biosynthesis
VQVCSLSQDTLRVCSIGAANYMVKVLHVSQTSRGGAWRAAERISAAIQSSGADSRLEAVSSVDTSHFFKKIGPKIDHLISKSQENSSTVTYFSAFINSKDLHTIVKNEPQDTIINFHWIPGAIRYLDFELFKSRKVIWTLHDMRPFTGACHYSIDCDGYKRDCERCPQVSKILRPIASNDLQARNRAKDWIEKIKFVSPSDWLAKCARESTLLKNSEIRVIRNPFPTFDLPSKSSRGTTHRIGLLGKEYVKSKNSQAAFTATMKAISITGIKDIELKFIGSKFDHADNLISESLPSGSSEYEVLNFIRDCDFLVYSSLADNFPNLLVECQTMHVPIIAYDVGGVRETFENGITGFAVKPNVDALTSAIVSRFDASRNLKEIKKESWNSAKSRFDPKRIGEEYLTYYKS